MSKPASFFHDQLSDGRANRLARAELTDTVSLFMLRFSQIVDDPRLAQATASLWDESGLRIPQRVHTFTCEGVRSLEVPGWAGTLLVPTEVSVIFAERQVEYHLTQQEDTSPDDLADDFREFTLVLSSPYDVRHAGWRTVAREYTEDDDRQLNFPGDERTSYDNEALSALVVDVESALVGGRFQRVSPSQDGW